MKGAKTKSPDNVKVYALLAVIIGCSLGYAFWPTVSSGAAVTADNELISALIKENERLRGGAVAAPVVAAAVSFVGPAPRLGALTLHMENVAHARVVQPWASGCVRRWRRLDTEL